MNRCRYLVALAVGAAVALLSARTCLSQDLPSEPPAKKEREEAGKATGPRADRPPHGEKAREPRPPREDDFDGPPRKPPRDGVLEGPPAKPPRDGEFGGPSGMLREGGFGPPRRRPRDGDLDRPPLGDRDGPPGANRRPPGPPRWPHEDWASMEKNDPEMFKLLQEDLDLERQTREQAMQYRRAPKAQREKIKVKLQELVNKHFDVRQQRRSLELKRLDEELKRLREAMDRREKARKDLVERRVVELLGPDEDPGF